MKIKDLHQSFKSNFRVNLCDLDGNETNECKASFGLLTDVQYADHDDSYSVDRTWARDRFYRGSLQQVAKAIESWKNTHSDKNFKLLIQLGDLIDGKASPHRGQALDLVMAELTKVHEIKDEHGKQAQLLHIWGNHEFYNFKRSELVNSVLSTARELGKKTKSSMEYSSPNANYYSVDVSDKLRLICLDCFEIAAIGYEQDDPIYAEAVKILRHQNPNEDLNSGRGLEGDVKRFVKYNGAISATQFEWLTNELIECRRLQKKAIICGHVGVVDLEYQKYLLWNHLQVLNLLNVFRGTVIAYLSGHNHVGEYYLDEETGIHHITLPGIIETEPNKCSFATVELFGDRIVFVYCHEQI